MYLFCKKSCYAVKLGERLDIPKMPSFDTKPKFIYKGLDWILLYFPMTNFANLLHKSTVRKWTIFIWPDQQVRLYKEKYSLGIFLDINVYVLISKAAELRNNSSPSKIISLSPSVLKNVTYVCSSIVTYYAATYTYVVFSN